MEISEPELDEALHVAMTVGATRMQVMMNAERGKLMQDAPPQTPSAAVPPDQPVAPPVEATGPSFQAAEVVAWSGSG